MEVVALYSASGEPADLLEWLWVEEISRCLFTFAKTEKPSKNLPVSTYYI